MVNKKLADWIRSEEAQGYSEQQLRAYLLKQRYKKKDIEDAIALANSTNKINFKKFIKPTPLKLFFPILILILGLASHLTNTIYAPELGDNVCKLATIDKNLFVDQRINLQKLFHTENPQPNDVIKSIETRDELSQSRIEVKRDSTYLQKPMVLGNLYFYFSFVYKLNPLLPASCEWNHLETRPYKDFRCNYYINEEHYNCVKEARIPDSYAGSLEPIPYKKINHFDFIINLVLLSSIIYLIVSLISLAYAFLKKQMLAIKILASVLLILIPIPVLMATYNKFIAPTAYYLFILVFVALLFIKNNQLTKKILAGLAITSLVLMIGGIFVVNYLIDDDLSNRNFDPPKRTDYEIFYCEDNEDLVYYENPEYENVELKRIANNSDIKTCKKFACINLCESHCNSKNLRIREPIPSQVFGTKPYCICNCFY